jgi:hypothetical protein
MQTATQAMQKIGQAANPQKLQQDMMQFQRENAKMDTVGEMMDDMMDVRHFFLLTIHLLSRLGSDYYCLHPRYVRAHLTESLVSADSWRHGVAVLASQIS